MKEFKAQLIDTPGVIARVSTLFEGHPQLILGFNNFLPPGYKITYDEATGLAKPTIPSPSAVVTGDTNNNSNAAAATNNSSSAVTAAAAAIAGAGGPPRDVVRASGSSGRVSELGMAPAGSDGGDQFAAAPNFGDSGALAGKQQQHELTHARNYVKKIKIRFSPQPHIYKAFLEILHTYHKEQHTIRDVYNQVAKLFSTHPDLLEEFAQFLPDPSQAADMSQSIASARADANNYHASQSPKHQSSSQSSRSSQTSRGRVKGTRSRRSSKSSSSYSSSSSSSSSSLSQSGSQSTAPGSSSSSSSSSSYHGSSGSSGSLSHSGGQTTGSHSSPTAERVKKRPRSHDKSSSSSSSSSSSIPTYDEHEFFFSRMKQRLKNNPAYGEFLKVLHLFNEEIINRPQMMILVRDLLQDHPDLFERFRQYVSYEEPQEPPEVEPPSPASTWAEIDFTQCKRLGSSYRALPRANQNVKCSGRTPLAASVLNDIWVSFPTGTEDGFKSTRKNQYEETLFKIEDDRFELDLVIHLNAAAIRALDGINKRINALRRDELKAFKISDNELDVLHLRAVERIYGEKGQDIIDGLFANPVVAVPIILSRLQAKDQQWRQARNEWNKVWREIDEKNYYKSLDHQCMFFKQSEKKTLSPKNLISEIKQIVQDSPAVVSHRQPPHMSVAIPSFATIHDAAALLNAAAAILLQTRADRQRLQVFLQQFLLPFFFTKANKKDDAAAAATDSSEQDQAAAASAEPAPASDATPADSNQSAAVDDADSTASAPSEQRVDEEAQPQEEQHDDEKEQEQSASSATAAAAATAVDDDVDASRQQGDVEQHDQTDSAAAEEASGNVDECSGSPSPNKRLFFGSSSFYVFFRLLAFLIQRLHTVKTLAERASAAGPPNRSPSQIERLMFPHRAQKIDEEIADRYGAFTNKVLALLRGELEQAKFEDSCRELFGMSSFVLFTIDKLISQIIQQIRTILTDETSSQLLTLHSIEDARTNGFMESIYHSNAFQLLGNEQRCFRIEAIKQGNFGRLTFLLFHSAQEPKFVPLSSTKQFWVDYIETYLTDPPQDDANGLAAAGLDIREHRMFLLRNQKKTNRNVQRLSSAVVQSGLECKVCLSTYRLFYVEQTEDFFYIPGSLARARSNPAQAKKSAKLLAWQNRQLAIISS